MYTPTHEKFERGRMSSSGLRHLLPRHAKAYLWICFLVLVFGSMILSDNGVSLYKFFFAPWTGHRGDHCRIPANASEEISCLSSNPQRHPASKPAESQPQPDHQTPNSPPNSSPSPEPIFGSGPTAFAPSDVVILFKTGATSLWRRVPIHLSTTLSNPTLTPNIAIYSDASDQIVSHPIIDVLANTSSTLKSHPDFELYHAAASARTSNLYLESAAMDGDFYLPGGWRLDKYKFLPLAAHAAREWKGKKWYVYMEDDNYYFWNSLYAWLGTFDPSKPLFLGAPAARLGEDFAHGGSGFAISGKAMEITFGKNPGLEREWEGYALERCCGDQILSHVLAEYGVPRDRRYDHTEWAGLQALPTWRIGFGGWNWCSPIFNIHKVHQADVSRLWGFERGFQREKGERGVLKYRDLFKGMVWGALNGTMTEWDNEASEKWFASKEEEKGTLSKAEREGKPWFSTRACEKACGEWAECLSWKYADDACGLSSTVAQGRRIEAGIRMESGWMLDRIGKLAEKECEPLDY
ncbi:MAG: hypothetical protein MMC23_004475 [Stictis urceolatum]|nr:hypothetical protein [Stictis urceolata]